jgi:predicted nucleic acid-binding protein
MNQVLVDTSVWIDHFKNHNASLAKLLALDLALTHPMVLLELACGTPPSPRKQTLSDIGLLTQTRQASMSEVKQLIETEKLYGLGCGVVDMFLLASALITPGTELWTLDKRLSALTEQFGVQYQEVLH